MITVLLVDDQELIRIGLKALLANEKDIQVIADVGNGVDAIYQSRELRPNIAIVDVDMPGISGVEVTERVTRLPYPPAVIVLSVLNNPPWPQRLWDAGARGYVSKERGAYEIVEAIHSVQRGVPYFSPTLIGSLAVSDEQQSNKDRLKALSNREFEIMMMLVKGTPPEKIAELLHVSLKTVYTHRDHIRAKLGVKNDVELTLYAIRYNLLNQQVL